MAYVRKRGKSWTAEVYRDGVRESATRATKAEAIAWAMQREAELTGVRLPDRTLWDALDRYELEKAPYLEGSRWAVNKLRNLKAYGLARKRLASIAAADIAQWRDDRLTGPKLKGVGNMSPATVNRELNLLRSVLEAARRDWGWLRANPMADVSRPKNPKSRRRRISDDEIRAIRAGLGYPADVVPQNVSQRVAVAFLFALETAMRGGEIVRLRPGHVRELAVHLPKTKNGESRDVPLSKRARELLALLPADDPVFGLKDAQKDALFRAGRLRANLTDLHFHDSRAEAIFRLSKKLGVLELARMIGHRDPKSLMFYYETTADELAAKLD